MEKQIQKKSGGQEKIGNQKNSFISVCYVKYLGRLNSSMENSEEKQSFRDNLNEVFKVNETAREVATIAADPKPTAVVPAAQKASEDEDYDNARKKLNQVLSLGSDALENLIEIAKEAESPKAYESVASMIKALSDAAGKLVEVQVQKREAAKIEVEIEGKAAPADNSKNTQNNIFVGSTRELLDMLKGPSDTRKKEAIEVKATPVP